VTTGAVYARFGDKHGVAVALADRFVSMSFELMDSWYAQDRWASATPREIVDNWTRGAINYGRMYRPYLTLMLDDHSLRAQHTALIDHSSRHLADLLRTAVGEGVDEHFDGDVQFAARAILERFEIQDDDESHARISRLIRRITGVAE
jgi:AcrR family transcriptional regulator